MLSEHLIPSKEQVPPGKAALRKRSAVVERMDKGYFEVGRAPGRSSGSRCSEQNWAGLEVLVLKLPPHLSTGVQREAFVMATEPFLCCTLPYSLKHLKVSCFQIEIWIPPADASRILILLASPPPSADLHRPGWCSDSGLLPALLPGAKSPHLLISFKKGEKGCRTILEFHM